MVTLSKSHYFKFHILALFIFIWPDVLYAALMLFNVASINCDLMHCLCTHWDSQALASPSSLCLSLLPWILQAVAKRWGRLGVKPRLREAEHQQELLGPKDGDRQQHQERQGGAPQEERQRWGEEIWREGGRRENTESVREETEKGIHDRHCVLLLLLSVSAIYSS